MDEDAEAGDWKVKQGRFAFEVDEGDASMIGPDNGHYDTEAEAMYFGQLSLCGCGDPCAVHAFLVEACDYFDREKHGSKQRPIVNVAELVKSNPEAVAEFVAHFLNNANLLEHGGYAGASWQTERGKQFVEIGPMVDDD